MQNLARTSPKNRCTYTNTPSALDIQELKFLFVIDTGSYIRLTPGLEARGSKTCHDSCLYHVEHVRIQVTTDRLYGHKHTFPITLITLACTALPRFTGNSNN